MSLGEHTSVCVRQEEEGGGGRKGEEQIASVHTAQHVLCGLAGVITIPSLAKAHRLKENPEVRKS